MNKKTVGNSCFVMLFIVLLFLPFLSAAKSIDKGNEKVLTENDMRWKIDNLVGPVDYRYTSKVRSEVESYIFDYPKGAEELLGRLTIYFPLFEQKLNEKDLPEELKYLSVIESALKVNAYSRVGAAGLWQFMKGTAREYGLTVNRSIDQRYAVEESTEAALNYLSELYRQFDDWTLALAAYNCGPGNVRKAMRKSGRKDYWSIRQFLPRETRNYIPKFIAISYVMAYYNEYGLMPEKQERYHYETLEAKVYQHLSFDQIALLTGTPLEIVRHLNPSYRKFFIPANTNGMKLILPRESMYGLLEVKEQSSLKLIDRDRINFNDYIRENFRPEVARILMIEQNEEMSFASLPVISTPQYGSELRKNELERNLNSRLKSFLGVRRNRNDEDNFVYYRMRRGESIKDIANRTPEADFPTILALNDFKYGQSPPPGTRIKIRKNKREVDD